MAFSFSGAPVERQWCGNGWWAWGAESCWRSVSPSLTHCFFCQLCIWLGQEPDSGCRHTGLCRKGYRQSSDIVYQKNNHDFAFCPQPTFAVLPDLISFCLLGQFQAPRAASNPGEQPTQSDTAAGSMPCRSSARTSWPWAHHCCWLRGSSSNLLMLQRHQLFSLKHQDRKVETLSQTKTCKIPEWTALQNYVAGAWHMVPMEEVTPGRGDGPPPTSQMISVPIQPLPNKQ